MKIFNKNIAVVALSGILLGACTKDFADVNTNKTQPTDEDINRGGYASGGYFAELVQRPIPTGVGTCSSRLFWRQPKLIRLRALRFCS